MRDPEELRTLSFTWAGLTELASEVTRPIARISASFFHPAWGPAYITLWRADGTGLRLSSKMYDVAIQLEVGVLNFELVSTPLADEVFAALPPTFDKIAVFKLTVREENTVAESGIAIKASDGSEIAIVASAGPCHVALFGALESLPHVFEPEYYLEHYDRTPIS